MAAGTYKFPTDAGKAQSLAADLVAAYSFRDRRFQDEQKDFELKMTPRTIADPADPEKQLDPVALNDLKVSIMRGAAIMAGKPPDISVAANTEEDEDPSQRIEDFLRWWRTEAEIRHAAGLHNASLTYDEAQFLLLRGWLVGRLLLNPGEPGYPWCYELLDAATMYPCLGTGEPLYWVQVSYPSVSEVEGCWGKAAKALNLEGRRASDPVTVYSFYSATEMAVLAEGQWLKKPQAHKYGFCPIVAVIATGAPYRGTEQQQGDEWRKYQGESFITAQKPSFEEKRDFLTIGKNYMAKTVWPPTVLQTDEEAEPNEVPMGVGQRIVRPRGDAIFQSAPPPQGLAAVSAMLGAVQQGMDHAGIAPPLYGGQLPSVNNFEQTTSTSSAQDVFHPYINAMKVYYLTLYRRVLRLFATFGSEPVSFLSTSSQGKRTAAGRLDPQEAKTADTRIEVRFRTMMMQDRVANANLAVQLTREGLVDLDTARDELLDLPNPRLIQQKALGDQFWKDPDNVALGQLYQQMQYQQDPFLKAIATMKFNLLLEKVVQAMMAPPPPVGQGGGQVPPSNAQFPPGMLPPGLGPQMGVPPGMEAVGPAASGPNPEMDLLMAGAQIPGVGGPVPGPGVGPVPGLM